MCRELFVDPPDPIDSPHGAMRWIDGVNSRSTRLVNKIACILIL